MTPNFPYRGCGEPRGSLGMAAGKGYAESPAGSALFWISGKQLSFPFCIFSLSGVVKAQGQDESVSMEENCQDVILPALH